MMDKNFNSLAKRLENKIYGTEKGFIRFQLLKEDILDYCPDFKGGNLKVLDAGGGSGRFSRFCASYNHQVLLCDISRQMLNLADEENNRSGMENQIELLEKGLMEITTETNGDFDLVLLHGVAEWMEDPAEAIRHCCSLVRPGGYLSLLIYNTNKYILKRGFNGRLLKKDKDSSRRRKLTPTGRMSPEEIQKVLREYDGKVCLQSGIRVFNNFLKIIEPLPNSPEEWLIQERLYYRREPFASLGEHSHMLWVKS